MGKFKNFDDYLESKKDDAGTPLTPPQGKGTHPYFAPSTQGNGKPLVRVAEKPKNALGDMGIPELKDPKHAQPLGVKPSYQYVKTEDFINETSDLSIGDFVENMLSERKEKEDGDDFPGMTCQTTGKKVTPSALEVAKYFAHVLPHNDRARRTFLREVKSVNGSLPALLSELVNHNETYDEMVNQMGQPESKVSNRLAKAMNDNHQKFMTEMGMLMPEHVDAPMDQRMKKPVKDSEPLSDMPNDMSEVPPEDEGDPNAAGIHGDAGDVQPSMGLDGRVPSQAGDSAIGERKLNKEFAYHSMLKEMKNYEPMAQAMREMFDY